MKLNILGVTYVKHGALAYAEKSGVKFFIKAGSKFSLKLFGLELTNKGFVYENK